MARALKGHQHPDPRGGPAHRGAGSGAPEHRISLGSAQGHALFHLRPFRLRHTRGDYRRRPRPHRSPCRRDDREREDHSTGHRGYPRRSFPGRSNPAHPHAGAWRGLRSAGVTERRDRVLPGERRRSEALPHEVARGLVPQRRHAAGPGGGIHPIGPHQHRGDPRPGDGRRGQVSWESLLKPWVGMARGHMETLKQMVSPPVTRMYPKEPAQLSPRWRGPLRLRGVMDHEPPPVTDAEPLEFNDLMTELHEQRRIAPCQGGCPANVDARGQNALVAAGRYIEAYNLVRRRNVLPAVLGYVCNNPCEDVCRRSFLDDPIAIRQLHRDCYEVYDREARFPGHLKSLVHRPEHVAVVGAGPAGITAAYDLVQMGYRVTVYEREPLPGGLLVTSVPL